MNRQSILLVDDERLILNSLSRDLTRAGYDVKTAASGEAALAMLKQSCFDLVITDLVMEGINGIQVLQEAKMIGPDIAVIILTGYGNLTSAIDALRLGAADYLLKPCDCEELLFRIAACFQEQKLRRQIKVYENFIPVCAVCQKIRDDGGKKHGHGEWITPGEFISRQAGVSMSHGYCPECAEKTREQLHAKR